MKTSFITAALLAVTGVSAVYAQAPNLVGGSSNDDYVEVGPSTFPPLAGPLGYSGLAMRRTDGEMSGFIDLHGGPVTQVTNAVGDNANQPGD